MSKNHFKHVEGMIDFEVTSEDLKHGEPFSSPQLSGIFGVEGGEDVSPSLFWQGAPSGTKSYVVTAYHPTAPTGSGFWHWVVANIPASVSSLPTGAGDVSGENLPAGAFQLSNDAGIKAFLGAAPPPGSGNHNYYFVVHALDVEKIDLPDSATPALFCFNILGHTLGRATIVATCER